MAETDYKCSQLDGANLLSMVLFIQVPCPCALISPFPFYGVLEGSDLFWSSPSDSREVKFFKSRTLHSLTAQKGNLSN